ncbi:MAG: TraB/VirB10 family protein [Deltaproteobacteria bacterium]|jgi:conjugal transfer pilus assembly protein TraB|nr:TraB/VirB10 family protein [Deltaproteobacteria bacterium]
MNISDLTTHIREFWLNLSSGQRRIATFGVLILAVATIYYVATPDRAPRERREQKSPFDFTQPDMAAEVMAEKLQNSIQSQKAQMQAMQQRLEMLESKQQRGTTASPSSSSGSQSRTKPFGEDALLREMNRTIGSSEIVDGGQIPYAPAPVLQLPLPSGTTSGQQTQVPQSPQEGAATPAVQPKKQTGPNGEDIPPPRSLGVLSWSPPASMEQGKVEKPTPQGFYVPSASFFSVSLLTGLDAPTGNKAKNQPSPLALRVQDLSWLPNEVRQNVRGCFLLAEGIGELSTERVNIRGMTISCVNNDGERVIDQKLLGYVADSDGKAGMRGEVVSKAGKLLAETMKVGFIQGLGEFFQFNARSLTVTDSGAISSPNSNDLGNALLGGTSSGIGRALDKVASYYMSLAEEIFPVIQVGATRSATFVVTQGTEIVFDKQLSIGKKDGAYDL